MRASWPLSAILRASGFFLGEVRPKVVDVSSVQARLFASREATCASEAPNGTATSHPHDPSGLAP
jgi:hypothetical protein